MKAVIYARYSSDLQRTESIDAQVRSCKDYADKNDLQIIKLYADEAKSGTSDDRDDFLKMIKDSERGYFDVVIVHKLDRFARNRYDSAFYKRLLKNNGVRLISVLEQFDDSPESIILESVLEGMAEYYSANLARETMKGLKENALKCKFNGGIPPLGYDVDKDTGKYIINEMESKIVRLIFNMYADGHSYQDISSHLNNRGYKTKRGSNFAKNSLHDLLKNERYLGIYIFNRAAKKANGKFNKRKEKPGDQIVRIGDGIPTIIDQELFERVKERMSIQKGKKSTSKASIIYLLSGKLYCGLCGYAMVGNRRVSGDKVYASYECGNRKRKHECSAKSITKSKIEMHVLDDLVENILSYDRIEEMAQKTFEFSKLQNIEAISDIQKFQTELSEIQIKISHIVNAIAEGMFHLSMKEKMNTLEARKAELEIFIDEAKRQIEMSSPTIDDLRAFMQKDMDIKNKPEEEQKRILQRYVKQINLYPKQIEVNYIVDYNGCGTRIRTQTD